MVLPGTVAILLFSDFDLSYLNYRLPDGSVCANLSDCPNMTYPVLLFQLLPTGLLGLVLAGLLAAMMSSVSATFNSASTLITMDFVKQWRPTLTSKQLVRTGQVSTLILVILASLWATQIDKIADTLWLYLQLVLSYICPPVVAVFILGIFWRRANADGAFYSLLSGFVVGLFLILSKVNGWCEWMNSIHFLHQAFLLFAFCLGIHSLVSLMTESGKSVQRSSDDLVWSIGLLRAEDAALRMLPWYQNYRILSVLLLIVTGLLVGFFW